MAITCPLTQRDIPAYLILERYCYDNLKSLKHKFSFCTVMTSKNQKMKFLCVDCYTGSRASSQIFLLQTSHQTGMMVKLLEHWLMLLHQVGHFLSLYLLFYKFVFYTSSTSRNGALHDDTLFSMPKLYMLCACSVGA